MRRTGTKGGRVRENIPLNKSIITAITYPYISQRGSHQARNNDPHSENSLEIILLDWTNVLHQIGTGVKGKEADI